MSATSEISECVGRFVGEVSWLAEVVLKMSNSFELSSTLPAEFNRQFICIGSFMLPEG
jgi:hypothetical protein